MLKKNKIHACTIDKIDLKPYMHLYKELEEKVGI